MSGFTALNVELEDTFEEEVDDTKEIQIEEAFKLYQNALKLHSQGPEFYAAAEDAYKELFESEVFKYPEALTDYGHEQLDDAIALATPAIDRAPVAILPANAADSAANSLPQLIYLSYKNRAQFVIDDARYKLEENVPRDRKSICQYYYKHCLQSLEDSASALERDDTDIDLWKKAARISDVLSSQRLARFCLESVVAGDDDTGEQTVDLSGLDEAYASGELAQVLEAIQDDTAVSKVSATQPHSRLLQILQKSNDPYPYFPPRAPQIEYLHDNQHPNKFDVRNIVIELEGQTHAALTQALARALGGSGHSDVGSTHGRFLVMSLPTPMEAKADSGTQEHSLNPSPGDTSVDAHSHPHPTNSPHESLHSPASYHSATAEVQLDTDGPAIELAKAEVGSFVTGVIVQDIENKDPEGETQPEISLPTRKRSSTAAGMEEPESRTKSKRLRARESLLEITAQEEETALGNDYYIREQFAILEDHDSSCFSYVDKLLSSLGLPEVVRLTSSTDRGVTTDSLEDLQGDNSRDMNEAFSSWTEEMSAAIMAGNGSRDEVEKSGGMSLFQRHLKAILPEEIGQPDNANDGETIGAFVRYIEQTDLVLADAAVMWLIQLLITKSADQKALYLSSTWTREMREDMTHMILNVDQVLDQQIQRALTTCQSASSDKQETPSSIRALSPQKLAEFAQSLFEIHLDRYYEMSSPQSKASDASRDEQKDRLRRWAHALTDTMQNYVGASSIEDDDPLLLRFLFSSAMFTGLLADEDKSQVMACLADIKAVLIKAGNPIINLPNNRAMPQLSIAAIDREISRLSTLDFFNSVFDSDNSDPVATIIKLEPILESENGLSTMSSHNGISEDTNQRNKIKELRAFLDSGDASLKLFLWRRLQNGYAAISYAPKVVSCLLRSLEIIVQEISTDRHKALQTHDRRIVLLKWIRDADDIVNKVLSKIADEATALECLDEDHLLTSISAIINLTKLLYEFVKFDDSIRLGQLPSPTLRTNSAMKLFEKSRDRMRDAFVRIWTLLYYLFKDASTQMPEHFHQPVDQLAEYLRAVHSLFGQRQYCKQASKLFVKLAKTELLSIKSEIDYSEDVAQVLYDMYQIRLGAGFGDANHGCIGDFLGRDKETAFSLVPIIMTYACKLNMRELVKSELKSTVDKIQQTLGQVKPSPILSFNRKAISGFLKSSINPQELYRALKGVGDLITKPVEGEYAKVAATGWYQLLGRMSLAKYKSVKRVNPTPTEDLETAGTFLRLDLEHNIHDWESWYRLAQVFDSKIEDSLIWNSLKINDSRGEIALLERNSINAYSMAIATAMRTATDTTDTVQKISDMYTEFAFRLYASSRPPLNMEAFSTEKNMRHLSSSHDQSMSKAPFIIPFSEYQLWSLAAYLLQRKYAAGQKEWLCYYTLGKCFWKMYQHPSNAKAKKPVTIEDVLDAFTDAVDLVPAKEKSTDYILEPHFKLVSVVHKLVSRGLLSPAKGTEYLQTTQFARSVHHSQDEHSQDEQDQEWDTYILAVLRKLGQADKSNWHHRITARAAHISYDGNPGVAGALGAKHQFTQQIFTKTMTMQVWKPEYERPGRHYVYTGRYLSFFVHLLDCLNDRAALEQLVRRIRRKTTDFLDHPRIWEETAMTYVKLLRRVGKIPNGKERSLFDKISYEDFSKAAEKVEKWAHDPENTYLAQEIMQDAIELKKLNNSLMKGPAIDDLIGDSYACMYEAFVSQLPPEEAAASKATTLPQGTFINMNTDLIPTGDDNLDRMRLNNLLSAQTDGAVHNQTPGPPATGLGLVTTPADTSPDPVRIPTPSKPGRVKTITRREVQRKAEACIVKQPPPKTPTLLKRPFVEIPARRDTSASNLQQETDNEKSRLEDVVQDDSRMGSRRPSMSARGSAEPNENEPDADADGEDDNDGEADDESELTDLENEDEEDDAQVDSKAIFSSSADRKRKADANGWEEEEAEGEGSDHEDADVDQAQEPDDEGEDNDTGAEVGKDEMEVDEQENVVVEIQDSQDASDKIGETQVVNQNPQRSTTRSSNKKA